MFYILCKRSALKVKKTVKIKDKQDTVLQYILRLKKQLICFSPSYAELLSFHQSGILYPETVLN